MPLKVSPEEAIDEWKKGMKGAGEKIRRGVKKVTESPTAKAADKIDKMRAGFNEAIDSGKTERALREVSTQEWIESMETKGVQNIASGVDRAAVAKRQKMINNYRVIEAVADEVNAMPNDTFEERMEKMNQNARKLHATKGQQ